jgi:hypothetical protein|tara:strand:- start:2373 stop:2642 length:270 start_codon:yes stop_codon:yes gene_type:complete
MGDEQTTPIGADHIQHTNIHGDISEDKKHFLEISLDGFRLCLSTSENITLNDFNRSAMKFWTELDEFLQNSSQKRRKTMRMGPDNMEVG